MGSWNATCGISNLHIKDDDEVMVFVLEQQRNIGSLCYSTAFYKPLLLPFYAKYDDYGNGKDCSGSALSVIMECIKLDLVEMEVGKNQYHDIAVKKEEFNEELFFEAIHEQRLFIKGHRGNIPLSMVMMRKDIADHILYNWIQRDYVGNEKGTCGWNNAYIQYNFQDILNDIPDFINRVTEYIKQKQLELGEEEHIYRMFDKLSSIFEWNDPNKVSKFIKSDSHHYSKLIDIERLIFGKVRNNEIEYITQIIEDHLKGLYIEYFFNSTRKSWLPGAHQGSQSMEHDGYLLLNKAIQAAITKEQNDFDEDYD